jgi:hypothetical protein
MGHRWRQREPNAIHVTKEWARIEGFDWLIESVPLEEALPQLNQLPAPKVARKVDTQLFKTKMLAKKKKGAPNQLRWLGLNNRPKTKEWSLVSRKAASKQLEDTSSTTSRNRAG